MFLSTFIEVATNAAARNSSWVYFVDWILALILGLAFVFYFNRLIAVTLTAMLNLVLWQMYRIRVDIEALRFSPLGGRISARNVSVITADHTVSVLRLNFTWRYWIFGMVRFLDMFFARLLESGVLKSANDGLPCRFSLMVDGLEVFMYNRSVAYDQMVEALQKKTHELSETASMNSSTSSSSTAPLTIENSSLGRLLRVLPLQVRIRKGTVVVGNQTTPSIMVASYTTANGIVDVSPAALDLDLYRSVFDFQMEKFQVLLKPNVSYKKHAFLDKPPVVNIGQKDTLAHRKRYKAFYRFQTATTRLSNAFKKRFGRDRASDEAEAQWRGLQRYVGESTVPTAAEGHSEYAKYSLVVDLALTRFVYYYDIPGPNLTEKDAPTQPEFGVDIDLSMATVHYGPWADKQRVPLQNMFFPTLSRDLEPTRPSTTRQYGGFRVAVSVRDEVVFRVPTRESSKDQEFLQAIDPSMGQSVTRPFGWVELKADKGTQVCSFTPYIATEEGWGNRFSCDFVLPEVRTSVNHDILFTADSHCVDGDIGFPLSWNGTCHWTFKNHSKNAKMFFLREHTMLISDLFSDFSSGDPQPYEYFRPFVYALDWDFEGYKIFLNVNDLNIVDNPLDFSSNKFLLAQGAELGCHVEIPVHGNFSSSSTVKYLLFTSYFDLVLDTPPWHTANSFMKTNLMGRANAFSIDGSYTYFHAVEINTSNTVVIHCVGDFVTLKFHGVVIKYLFTLKENYFGDHTKFHTFEEYSAQQAESLQASVHEPDVDYWRMEKRENDTDVFFSFCVRLGLIVVPYHLYDCSTHIGLSFDLLDVDIRVCNFYMDLQADFGTAQGVLVRSEDYEYDEMDLFDIPKYRERFLGEKPDIFFDSFTVHTHRVLGIPPDEIIYYCKWDFAAGDIVIDSQGAFLAALATAGANFGLGFSDLENTLSFTEPTIYDAANFSFRCPKVHIRLCDEGTTVEAVLDQLLVNFTDMNNPRYSNKVAVLVPLVTFKVFDSNRVYGYVKTGLDFNNICQRERMEEHRRHQQDHVRKNDAPTHRAPFILPPEFKDSVYNDAYGSLATLFTLPDASFPLNEESYNHYCLKSGLNAGHLPSTDEKFHFRRPPPTTNYDDADFCPSYITDPNYTYDSFICDMGEIQGFLTPQGISHLAKMVDCSSDYSLEALMDSLHRETVSQIETLVGPKNGVDNVRFVSSEIDLRLSDYAVEDPEDVFLLCTEIPFVNVCILEPSVAFSHKVSRTRNAFSLNEFVEVSAAFHLSEVFISISKAREPSLPASLTIKDVEGWLTNTDTDGLVSSFTVENVAVDSIDLQVPWAVEYLSNLTKYFGRAIDDFGRLSLVRKHWKSLLVYKLASASADDRVEHDPNTLTKPSSVIRSSQDHVRSFDGWKIVMRLRHSLVNMLLEWFDRHDRILDDTELPETAFEEVIDIFSRWRSWEANEIQRRQFFSDIFGISEKETSDDFEVFLQLSSAIVKVLGENSDIDFINLQALTLSASVIKENYKDLISMNLGVVNEIKNASVIFGLGSYESKISILTLDLVAAVLDTFSTGNGEQEVVRSQNAIKENGKREDPSPRPTGNWHFSYCLHLGSMKQHIFLPFSCLELVGKQAVHSGKVTILNEKKNAAFGSLSSVAQFYDLGLYDKKNKLFGCYVEGLNILLANFGEYILGSKVVDIGVSKSNVKVVDSHGKLVHAIRAIVDQDVAYLKAIFELNLAPESQPESAPVQWDSQWELLEQISGISFNLHVAEFTWFLELLNPLRFSGGIYENRLSVNFSQGIADMESFIQKVELNFLLSKDLIVRLENSKVASNAKISHDGHKLLAVVTMGLGYTKLSNPQITRTLDIVMQNMGAVRARLQELKQLLKSFGKEEPQKRLETEKSTTGMEFMKFVAFQLNFSNDYIGFSTFCDHTRCSFEVEGISLGACNVTKVSLGDNQVSQQSVPLHGHLTVPTIRISVIDKSIPVGLSKLLDFNLSIKALADLERAPNNEKSQSLQIESQYCRICLSPPLLSRVVSIIDGFTNVLNKHIDGAEEVEEWILKEQKPATGPQGSPLFSFASVHVLSYNFCIGWLFGGPQKDYPGIIVGAERFFAVALSEMAKLSLMEGYLSVANGQTSSNFFSTLSESNNLNRAFLPTMQMAYVVDKAQYKQVKIYGDELDVKFLSNSIVILEHAVNSVNEVQRQFSKRSKPAPRSLKRKKKPELSRNASVGTNEELQIEIVATFAGSNVLFYRLNDDESQNPPSLFLHAPAVQIAAMYHHQRDSVKKHEIKVEVCTSESDNTLYSSCVPVISDIVDGVKGMMRKTNVSPGDNGPETPNWASLSAQNTPEVSQNGQFSSATSENGPKTPQKEPKTPQHGYVTPTNGHKSPSDAQSDTKDFNFGNILREADIHIGLKIEKQRLSLSCEPTAKVEAIVGLDGIYIQVNSGTGEVPSLITSVQFDAISATLQHIYSRQISGSARINRVVMMSSVFFDSVTTVLSSGAFSNVSGYINVKQYQDVDLFKDIWFPKTASKAPQETPNGLLDGEKLALASNKNISSRFKEVSTTYALPWVLTFMVLDASLQVDFGSSLGNFLLETDRCWAVSKKSTDWAQDLKLGINKVSLHAEGRLGGLLLVTNAYLHTAISWKIDLERTLDVPLILVSLGVDNLQLKSSFDGHVFAIANIEGCSADIYNRKSETSFSKDHLFVTVKVDTSEIYVTSLTASNVLDIYNTIDRMIQENRKSYKQTLRDSSKGRGSRAGPSSGRTANSDILETVKKLETKFEVVLGRFVVHVYPSSFDDSKVLVVKLDELRANFQQNEYFNGISNELELQFNDLKVLLSVAQAVLADFILECSVDEFVEHARKARGGTIFVFPRFMISMRTFQRYHLNEIEYLYQLLFGGTVDVRWNLGLVNFIREMFSIHQRSLASRTQYRKKSIHEVPAEEKSQTVLKKDVFGPHEAEPTPLLKQQLTLEGSNNDIDRAISSTMEKVTGDLKYKYVPLAAPIIEAPQLKELGNATPPLEWFGLYRNKLPNATHQMGIVTLQKLIHEVELQYLRMLGKA